MLNTKKLDTGSELLSLGQATKPSKAFPNSKKYGNGRTKSNENKNYRTKKTFKIKDVILLQIVNKQTEIQQKINVENADKFGKRIIKKFALLWTKTATIAE